MGLYPDKIIIKPQKSNLQHYTNSHLSGPKKLKKKKNHIFNTQITVVKSLGDKPLSKIRFLQKNWT